MLPMEKVIAGWLLLFVGFTKPGLGRAYTCLRLDHSVTAYTKHSPFACSGHWIELNWFSFPGKSEVGSDVTPTEGEVASTKGSGKN